MAELRARYRHFVWSNPDGAKNDVYIAAALRRANFFELLDFAAVLGLDRLEAVWMELLEGEPPVSPSLAAEVSRIFRNLQPVAEALPMLRAGTRELWHRLESEPAMSGCVLIGGSALAPAPRSSHQRSLGLCLCRFG